MITRRLGTLLTVAVLVASGTYLLVYLYRWEWNRALVAGVFFIAAEVALVATELLRRLRSIEARLDAGGDGPTPLERIRESAPEPRDRFAWLDPTRMNVFVPVLLGAGMILSVAAHAVERISSATAGAARDHHLAASLGALALPPGGLLPAEPSSAGLGPLRQPAGAGGWRSVLHRGFGGLIAVFLLVAAVDVIADNTQDRPDPIPRESAVDIRLDVRNRFTTRSPALTAEALFGACRHTIGGHPQARDFRDLGDGVIAFTIAPSFGDHAERRFEGCLEDAMFDRVSASVVAIERR